MYKVIEVTIQGKCKVPMSEFDRIGQLLNKLRGYGEAEIIDIEVFYDSDTMPIQRNPQGTNQGDASQR